MPLVRITMQKGRPAYAVTAIADGVHQALVETFDVPPHDRFQILEQRDPADIVYDASYLGIARTDGIILIHIVASATRDIAAKRALYRAIADRLAALPGVRREDVQIVLSPNTREDWSFGNGVASYAPGDEP